MGHYSHEGCNERLQNLNAINKIGPNRTLFNVSSYVKVKLRIETFGSDRISDKDFRIGSDNPIRNYPIRSGRECATFEGFIDSLYIMSCPLFGRM